MASYSLDERFKSRNDCYRLMDPTAYDVINKSLTNPKQNKYPFLSGTPRQTLVGNKTYTDAIYYADIKPTIPNITSIKSKRPRFSYESFSPEDLRNLLCRCGFEDSCECPAEENQSKQVICQAHVRKRLFKGPVPHSAMSGGLSCPSKEHRGYDILTDGSTLQIRNKIEEECPPFYDARVMETTQFYRGWKWSKWTSQRTPKLLEVRPGPADYTLIRSKTQHEICAENLRAERRSQSKQPRYIEMIQERLLREGCPGPAHYSPGSPKRTNLKYLGSKTERFLESKYDKRPSPGTYFIKRAFDLPQPLKHTCLAKLPKPSCFGVKAPRFRYKVIEGPGPAEYDAAVKRCKIQHCSTAPFGCSAIRFKDNALNEYENETDNKNEQQEANKVCPSPTWQFRSRTSRFKPLTVFDPIIPKNMETKVKKSTQLQYLAPFNTSAGRFQPWKDWMPVYGAEKTPGPGYYNLEKPRCLPAVYYGPLYRTQRFTTTNFSTPAANKYKVGGGVETVLATHNERLKKNIKHKYPFTRKQSTELRHYSLDERELMMLDKAIAQMEARQNIEESSVKKQKNSSLDACARKGSGDKPVSVDRGDRRASVNKQTFIENEQKWITDRNSKKEFAPVVPEPKQKLLRTFLYRHPQPIYF